MIFLIEITTQNVKTKNFSKFPEPLYNRVLKPNINFSFSSSLSPYLSPGLSHSSPLAPLGFSLFSRLRPSSSAKPPCNDTPTTTSTLATFETPIFDLRAAPNSLKTQLPL